MALTLIAKGAEADILIDIDWNGRKVLLKRRGAKKYRHPQIDRDIRRYRTLHEADLIHRAKEAGVPTPLIYQLDPEGATIVMEFVEGEKVRDVVPKLSLEENRALFHLIGEEAGRLHNYSIIHGDLTTSNMIKTGNRVVFIDFGLGEVSKEVEKRGVDFNLMVRMLASTHYTVMDPLLESFKDGYRAIMGAEAEEIFQRADDIRRRGRYIDKD
ncbi:MAG: Kae1-associated kinase Bud32 [Candidatus Bathyarchaeia archaeon]